MNFLILFAKAHFHISNCIYMSINMSRATIFAFLTRTYGTDYSKLFIVSYSLVSHAAGKSHIAEYLQKKSRIEFQFRLGLFAGKEIIYPIGNFVHIMSTPNAHKINSKDPSLNTRSKQPAG